MEDGLWGGAGGGDFKSPLPLLRCKEILRGRHHLTSFIFLCLFCLVFFNLIVRRETLYGIVFLSVVNDNSFNGNIT